MHTLLVDDLRARLMTDRQILGFAQVMGVKDVELPDIDAEIQAFEKFLESVPEQAKQETEERRVLLKALGLRQ